MIVPRDHVVEVDVPLGALVMRVVIAPSCAMAASRRASATAFEMVVCVCELGPRLLAGASEKERAALARAAFWLCDAEGPHVQ